MTPDQTLPRGVKSLRLSAELLPGHVIAEDGTIKLSEEQAKAILDIRLPGMSGLDALDQLKRLRPRLPVIVMTGQGTTFAVWTPVATEEQ